MWDIHSVGHLSPFMSSLLIDGAGTLGLLALIVHAWVRRGRNLREAQAADAAANQANPGLVPGPTVLFGRVEYAQGAKRAVRVEVDQDGEEWENSGLWTHKWTETRRRINVEPFYLAIDEKTRIRIEPTREVFLVDDMDGLIRVNLTERVKFAELTPGECIYASGDLVRAHDPEALGESGYRSTAQAWVLRPLPGKSMLLSSKPLGARFRERAAFYRGVARWYVIVLLVLHAMFHSFHVRRYFGETIEAKVTRTEIQTSKDDDGADVYTHHVIMHIPPDVRVTDQVPLGVYNAVKVGQVVPLRYVKGSPRLSTIGPGVTVNALAWIWAPLLLVAWVSYRKREQSTRPWYERLVEDRGSGRLEETLRAEQARSARS